jgi:hypothetical protein
MRKEKEKKKEKKERKPARPLFPFKNNFTNLSSPLTFT